MTIDALFERRNVLDRIVTDLEQVIVPVAVSVERHKAINAILTMLDAINGEIAAERRLMIRSQQVSAS